MIWIEPSWGGRANRSRTGEIMKTLILLISGIVLSFSCLAENPVTDPNYDFNLDPNYNYDIVSTQTPLVGACQPTVQQLCANAKGELIKIQMLRSFCLGICRTVKASSR